jgi:hypothetical protein
MGNFLCVAISSLCYNWEFVCRCMDEKGKSRAKERCLILIGKGRGNVFLSLISLLYPLPFKIETLHILDHSIRCVCRLSLVEATFAICFE